LRVGQGRVQTTTQTRRRQNKAWNQGLEINKAEGGNKSIVATGASRQLSIECYGRILCEQYSGTSYRYVFQLKDDQYSSNYNYLNLTTILNSSQEFLLWCSLALRYKVVGVSFSFDYAAVPLSKDVLSKMLLWLDTDKVEINEPLYERVPMKLDMSHQGIKNYNVRLRLANMKKENIDWLNSTAAYNGYLVLNLDSQDTVYLGNGDNFRLLGTFKVTINTLLTLKDKANSGGNLIIRTKPECMNPKPLRDGKENKRHLITVVQKEDKKEEPNKIKLIEDKE